MKKLTVVLFLICVTFGAWQQSGETVLPKSIQVDDLTINYSGEIWILSASSILKLEAVSKSPLLIQRIADAKLLSVLDEEAYVLDTRNRLMVLDLSKGDIARPTNLFFNAPSQLAAVVAEHEATIVVLEPNQLIFATQENILGAINTNADRFSTIPLANYNNTQTPLFTLVNNQIYSWTGGTFKTSGDYRNILVYSSSNNVLDFSVDKRGNLYVLFSDSIIVLESNGDYKGRIPIDNVPPESRLLVNPANNSLIIFNKLTQSLKILSEVGRESRGEIIVLNKNRPNPVDNYTEIEFTINQPLDLAITIYNLIGEPVKVVAQGYYTQGNHHVIWHADDEQGNLVPNGVYFYRLESKKGVAIKQLIVLR